jgi:hypothetical protein
MINYFNSLPTRSYTTTIGNFNIVDMTSYYTVNDSKFVLTELVIDSNDTLIETSKKIYDNIDSFWLFLFANKKINPFDLLEPNNSVQENTVAGFTGLQLLVYNSAEDAIFTNGSLIFPRTENTGANWEYGSTGEFDLNGGFALIESYNPFSKRAVIKYLEGFTFANANDMGPLKGIVGSSTGYTWYEKQAGIYGITQELGVASKIEYSFNDVKDLIKVNSEYPLLKKGSGQSPYEPVGTGGVVISNSETIKNTIPKIQMYLKGSLKDSFFKKITQNYRV